MESAVEMIGIDKFFASTNVQANKDVDLSVARGEVHALVGENGAGKTTLMNILYGLLPADRGEIRVYGNRVQIGHPDDAIRLGIGMVHQHFKLVPSFTVAENVILGMEPNTVGVLRRSEEAESVRQMADSYGLPVDPGVRVRDLPVGMQQRVEILKLLQRNAHVLILDEPTAVLTPQESRELFEVVRKLAESGRSVIFITHKLFEVMDVADRVTVMRRGERVGTKPVSDTNIAELARMMVGREVLFNVERKPARPGELVLEVDDLLVAGAEGVPAIRSVSFTVRQGEIFGIAGVNGNGQTELAEAITGMRRTEGGSIKLRGVDITRAPSTAGGRRASPTSRRTGCGSASI